MQPQTKFMLKAWITFLIFEPWYTKVRFQLSTLKVLNFVGLIISILIFKSIKLFILFMVTWILIHCYSEWKSKRFIFWYRMRNKKLRKWRETMSLIRKEKRNQEQEQPKGLNTITNLLTDENTAYSTGE